MFTNSARKTEAVMGYTKSSQNMNLTKLLIVVIAVLVVILAVVIGIAVTGNPPHTPTEDPGQNSGQNPPGPNPGGESVVALQVTPQANVGSVTYLETMEFTGVSDVNQTLTVNGTEVTREQDGTFACQVPLLVGKNEFVFVQGDQTFTFQIERKYTLKDYAPMGDKTYGSGATIRFEVVARKNSEVTAQFNGKTVTLKSTTEDLGYEVPEGFLVYTAQYKLPTGNTTDVDLGTITYTAICDNVTETAVSGNITCQKPATILSSDSGVTPSYGNYINVGSGYVVEIVGYTAETFDGKTTDDWSHPTNNYLPKGTLDYCSTQKVGGGKLQYIQMRCGYRVYVDKKNQPLHESNRTQISQCYPMVLPDHNEIGFVSMEVVGNQTVLVLDTLWKAPFLFDLLPQEYAYPNGGSDRNYEITSFTATHVDITLCYTTVFTGTVQIPEGNPVFKSAEIIQNEDDCILRLHLRETGSFYGWDCYYNENDQLCFTFLNPATVTATEVTEANPYGADLTGVTIMLDIGHCGYDPGTVGTLNGVQYKEAERNMAMAVALKAELEKMGATVLLNRNATQTLTVDDRIQALKNAKPDLCIAIHHNSLDAKYSYYNGFETFYYTPYSMAITKQVKLETEKLTVYKKSSMTWHNYYVCRQTVCPVVLTENGYMSNEYDLGNIASQSAINQKVSAIAQATANYFLGINQ